MRLALSLWLVGLAACGSAHQDGTTIAPWACGNAIVETGEECDLGVLNDSNGRCTRECQYARCGDGVIGPEEECDDGVANADVADACRTTCTNPRCGDGVRDRGEDCDDGAENSMAPDACRPDCSSPTCGDGISDSGEGCDDGALNSANPGAACRPDCIPANCGDSIVDTNEECDLGIENGNHGACTKSCLLARCGDGELSLDEKCDDGADNADAANACRTNCELPTCGDGIEDMGEQCDEAGDGLTCDHDCTTVRCGDGLVNQVAGEACDQLSDVVHGWCAMGCQVACEMEFGNCDGNDFNGCETPLSLDPLNCGACGHDCGGGECLAGSCTALHLTDLIASDGSAGLKYFDDELVANSLVTTGCGSEICGGGMTFVDPAARQFTAGRTSNVVAYGNNWAVHGGVVYGLLWWPDDGEAELPVAFAQAPLLTSVVTPIEALGLSNIAFWSVSDGENLYWTAWTATGGRGNDEVRRYAFGAPSNVSHAAYRPSSNAGLPLVFKMASNSDSVFVAANNPNEIWRVGIDAAAPSPYRLAVTTSEILAMAATDAAVVYAGLDGIVMLPANCTTADTCSPTVLAPSTGAACTTVVADATHAYWSEWGCKATGFTTETPIWRVALEARAEVETVVEAAVAVSSMLVVGDYLYWVESAEPPDIPRLWKLAKPLS